MLCGVNSQAKFWSNWNEAEHDIGLIREVIEDPRVTQNPLKQLQLRLWLIHWSLFVYFHRPNGAVAMLDFFFGK